MALVGETSWARSCTSVILPSATFSGDIRDGEHVPQDHQAKRPSFPPRMLVRTTQIWDGGNQFDVIG